MATRKTATKTKKQVSIDLDLNLTKSQTKKVKSTIKKTPVGLLVCTLVMLFLSVFAGGVIGHFLTKNDCFELIGEEEVSLRVGEVYVDQGAKVIAFNKDVSNKLNISTNLKLTEAGYSADEVGTYYIVYTVNHFKYNSIFKIKKVRLVHFVEPSEDVEE